MTRKIAALLLWVYAWGWAASASAHHSLSVIDTTKPVWIKGAVIAYRPGLPHATAEIAAKQADGSTQYWIVEGPFPGRMNRIIALYGGDAATYLKPGDVVEVCGFRPKSQYLVQRSYGTLKVDREHFVHGQLMVMPDGQIRSWGPYGKLDNCVRPNDDVTTWQEFLNRDTLAHDLWCSGVSRVQTPPITPLHFIEDVNRALAKPCQ